MKTARLSPEERAEERRRVTKRRAAERTFPHARRVRASSSIHWLPEPTQHGRLKIVGVADDAPETLKQEYGVSR